jgi:acyl-coenzyme A thioesterase PaaI-like protein
MADEDALLSIQERLYPWATCFGCGHANPKGLHLRSYPRDGEVTADFTPWPEHDNGIGFLNGGIIATLLDCHSGAAVFHAADELGVEPADEMPYPFVTAGIDLRYLRPAPLDAPVELLASVRSIDETEAVVDVALHYDGKPRAQATALWKRWRPRRPFNPAAPAP